jgi:hypothetical protein
MLVGRRRRVGLGWGVYWDFYSKGIVGREASFFNFVIEKLSESSYW